MEEQGEGQDAEEGGEDGSHSQCQGTGELPQLVADENRKVYGEHAGYGLRYGQQVDEFFLREPFLLVDDFLFDEGDHGVASSDGEEAYLEKGAECV